LSEDQTTHVYVIAKQIDKDTFGAPVKIGIARYPHGRVHDLCTASPFKIGVVISFALPKRDMAKALENAFHTVMKEHRLHGEWFDLPPAKAISCMFANLEAFLKLHLKFSPEEVEQCVAMSLAHEFHQ